MTDPCWLPSAIMQTTGALLGLYLIVYVYASEKMEVQDVKIEKYKYSGEELDRVLDKFPHSIKLLERAKKVMSWSFYSSVFLGVGTIFANTFWLRQLIKYPDMIFPTIEFLSQFLFYSMLLSILIFTIGTVIRADEFKKLAKEAIIYRELMTQILTTQPKK